MFENVTTILTLTYLNKTNMPGENKKCPVCYKK